jgi:hypothetical protein
MNLKFTKNKSTISLLTAIVCLLAVSISSCSKSNTAPANVVPYGLVSVIYASPNAPAADFYVNNSIVNAAPLTSGNYIPYFKSVAGSVKAGFFNTGALTPIAIDTINIKANEAYTLFFANTAAKHDLVLVTDTIVTPANSGASIRLANMSPDAPNVDLVISGKVIISNKSYKQVSSFVSISTAPNDTLKIVQTGTNNVLGVVNAVTVPTGGVFTIWLYGLANGTADQALKANLMENALFY